MKNRSAQLVLLGSGIAILVLLLTLPIPQTIDSIDRGILNAEFRIRGERPVDSSIVVLYFSSDDLSILGDLPLKRSYYALLVNALDDLGAKAIGFDIGFTEQDRVHDEYDNVFCSVVKHSGRVVVSGYFRSLAEKGSGQDRALSQDLCYPMQSSSDWFSGQRPEIPFDNLLSSAAGFGHTNLDDYYRVPLLLQYNGRTVPSFFLDMLRVSEGVDKSDISFANNSVIMHTAKGDVTIPTDKRSIVNMNYSGKFSSIPSSPVISFLKAYDTMRAGRAPSMPVTQVAGRTVLVGIIAEGRSAFVPTPFQAQFPSVGIHAMAIHNALDGTFLTVVPIPVEYVLGIVFSLICAVLLARSSSRTAVFGIVSGVIILAVILFLVFAWSNTFVPPFRIFVMAFAVTVSLLATRHQQVQRELQSLTTEQQFIVGRLREKESLLAALERELSESLKAGNQEGSGNLVEDVKKFRKEIEQLKRSAGEELPAAIGSASGKDGLKDFYGILYHESGPMVPIVEFLKMIADNDAPVLILGESGTGKELVAKSIHQLGRRKEEPFIAVNCGALTETLLESELFGHERGSFTGAVKEKPGRFELADGGTIFLDEIGDTSEAFQVKLLRVLQEGAFERVGGVETRHVDVRVITATNRDIKKEVENKSFREDLFYRLNVFMVQLPPLRERRQDLPFLISALISRESPEMKVSVGALNLLTDYGWKGNIRELQSVIKRATLLGRADSRSIIHTQDLPAEIGAALKALANIEQTIMDSIRRKRFSRSAISETAAELGGLNRGTVSEYFRGECFRMFVERQWDVEATIAEIAGTAESDVLEKAEKKFLELLGNATENVIDSLSLEEVKVQSKPKYKNLAIRYHIYLDAIIESYYNKKWSIQ